jgi:hypothetical protein
MRLARLALRALLLRLGAHCIAWSVRLRRPGDPLNGSE